MLKIPEETTYFESLVLRYLFAAAQQKNLEILEVPNSELFGTKYPLFQIREPKTGKILWVLRENIYSDNSSPAQYITKNKFIASQIFRQHNLPTPESFLAFSVGEVEEILKNNFQLGEKIVVKPVDQGMGKDVHIVESRELALKLATEILAKYQDREIRKVLIQKFIEGEDLRIQVVGGRFFAACVRVPANVVGDGKNTIEKLIEGKNRGKIQHTTKCMIEIDPPLLEILEEVGLNLDSIPKKGMKIVLRKVANIGRGGDPIDVTEKVSLDYAPIVEQIAEILGVKNFAVDLVVGNEPQIIEVNAPCLWGHHHFALGQKRNVALAILDHYFDPESFDPQNSKYLL